MLVLGILGVPFATAPLAMPPAPRASVRRRVEPEVRRVVAEQLAVSPDDLGPAVSLTDELAADSLDVLELVLALESAFDIVVPPPAIAAIRSYDDVVDTVVASVLHAGRDEGVTDGGGDAAGCGL